MAKWGKSSKPGFGQDFLISRLNYLQSLHALALVVLEILSLK